MGSLSWLTGTASWMYIAVTQYLLGIRPTLKGLIVDPCVPADWKQFRITRIFRGTKYYFDIVIQTLLDGDEIEKK